MDDPDLQFDYIAYQERGEAYLREWKAVAKPVLDRRRRGYPAPSTGGAGARDPFSPDDQMCAATLHWTVSTLSDVLVFAGKAVTVGAKKLAHITRGKIAAIEQRQTALRRTLSDDFGTAAEEEEDAPPDHEGSPVQKLSNSRKHSPHLNFFSDYESVLHHHAGQAAVSEQQTACPSLQSLTGGI